MANLAKIMKCVLVSPLNWGLGHATRLVPIIKQLMETHEVVIGGNGNSLSYLRKAFPDLSYRVIPGVEVKLANRKRLNTIMLLLQLPVFAWQTFKEQRWLKQHADEFDVIVSDNRYGLSHPKLKCILITHQPQPIAPFFSGLAQWMLDKFINKFDEIWVPDDSEVRLSQPFLGTYEFDERVKWIGFLSAMEIDSCHSNSENKIVVLASGPEPGKSNFVIDAKLKAGQSAVIANNLSAHKLQEFICSSECIIAKAGYSTIMDAILLNKRAVFVATPGQTEQEAFLKNDWLKSRFLMLDYTTFSNLKSIDLNFVPEKTIYSSSNNLEHLINNL